MLETLGSFDSFVNSSEHSYYMKVRQFKNGTVEAVAKPVRPMEREFAKWRFENCPPGFGPIKTTKEKEEVTVSDYDKALNFQRSIKRAKQQTRWLVKEMKADRLLTLTYRENMLDRDRLKADFTRFLQLARAALVKEWVYVCVVETQERGAYHLHLAVRGWQRIEVLRRCWYQALGGKKKNHYLVLKPKESLEEPDVWQTPGQIDVTSPKGRWGSGWRTWDSNKLGGYLVKYMHKTFDESSEEKKRYWHSQGLSAPVAERIWLVGCELPEEAIREAHSILRTFFGLGGTNFDMWLSPDQTTFWVSGKQDSEEPPDKSFIAEF